MAAIPLKRHAQCCRRVGMGLRAGVDMRRIWNQETRAGGPQHHRHALTIEQRVADGDSLAEAMRDTDGYFPRFTCDLVDMGEQTGRLESVFLQLADHYEHLVSLRRTFLNGIAWPVIQLIAGIGVVGLLILILGMIKPAEGEPFGVFGLSGFSGLIIYLLVVGAVSGVIVLLVVGFWKGFFGEWPMKVVVRLPGLGDCIRNMALARLTWSLSSSLEAGLDAERAVRLSILSTQNFYYMNHVGEAERAVRQGRSFHEAFRETQVFPDDFVHLLETAEVSGTESESLLHLSHQYRERAESASQILARIASFAIWFLIAVLMVAVIFYLFMQLYMKPINDALEMSR